MSKKIILGAFISAFVTLPALESSAAESAWASADQMRARLIVGTDNPGTETDFDAALEVALSEGWHTYWKMPGDAGLAPRFDWAASKNVKSVDVFWPAPTRKEEMGLNVFGYTDGVVFPLRVHTEDSTKPTELALKFNAMVCKEICIPQEINVQASIPAGSGKIAISSSHKKTIDFAIKKIPQTDDKAPVKVETSVIGPDAIVLSVYSKSGFQNADAVAYTDELFFTAPPKILIDERDKTRALMTLAKPQDVEKLDQVLSGKMLHIYVTDGRNAYEQETKF